LTPELTTNVLHYGDNLDIAGMTRTPWAS